MSTDLRSTAPISPPVDLSSDDESDVLFYLAGEVPLSISDLASHCTGSADQVRDTLQTRFQKEVRIDKTGFVNLNDAARGQVVSAANPLISEALDEHKRGKELVEKTDYEKAAECYRRASEGLSVTESRLSSVGDVPKSLKSRLESVRGTHDKLLKETTKDTVTHRKLLSEQHEEEGDEAANEDDFWSAVDAYQEAIEAFQEAKDAVSDYNDNLLDSSSSKLDIRPFEQRLETLNKKLEAAKSNISPPTTEHEESEQSEPAESSGEPSPESSEEEPSTETGAISPSVEQSPSRGTVIEMIKRRREELGRMPKLQEIIEDIPWNQRDVLGHFGSWDEALEAAGIDKRQEIIEDIRETGKVVGGRPSTSDMNHYGSFSAGMVYDVFDSWADAVAAAGFGQESDSTLPGNTSGESRGSSESSSASGETSTDMSSTDESESASNSCSSVQEEQIPDPDPQEYASIDDLPPNKRFRGELTLMIDEERYCGVKRDASFEVSDADGETIQFDFWSTHDLDRPDKTGVWYVIEEVRLKQWETDDGIGRNLSSTCDTSYRRLDGTESADDQVAEHQSDSVEQIKSTTTVQNTKQETRNCLTASNKSNLGDDNSSEDMEEQDEDDHDEDGLLGSIESEFEAIE